MYSPGITPEISADRFRFLDQETSADGFSSTRRERHRAIWTLWPCQAMLICLAGVWCCDRGEAGNPLAAASQPDAGLQQVVFSVELADPVSPSAPVGVHRVVQFRDRNSFPVGYALLRHSTPVCTNNKCKVVEVTMHWNAVGYDERLECPAGKPLTKKEHVPFTAEDYAKLDSILKNRDSNLSTLRSPFWPTCRKQTGPRCLVGVTPLTVQESVVHDPAYTSWALWRWANGEIVPKLCRLTEQSCSPPYPKHLLHSPDRGTVDFALKYVIAHHPSNAQFLEDVLHVLEHGDREHVVLALRF